MPVSVQLLQFEGFAVQPEDIQFGETDGVEVLVNRNGAISRTQVSRDTLTVTIRGLNAEQANRFILQAVTNRQALVTTGQATQATITIAGKIIRDAVLLKATPSGTIRVGGTEIMESLQLEYEAQFYT